MKNKILFTLLLVFGVASAPQAQTLVTKTLTKTLTLKITATGGDDGASVAWNPKQKKYYAAMTGGTTAPLQVFDESGKLLSDTSLVAITMFDVRGLWYNPIADALQGNGYKDYGWAQYTLGANGIPISVKQLFKGLHQATEQSVGVFVPKDNAVYFFANSIFTLEKYNTKNADMDTGITLYPGATEKPEGDDANMSIMQEKYNENAIAYTGINNAEIGLLNVEDKQIELYNLSTGLMQQALKLPADAPVNASLNFSYANGIYWLFNKTDRSWVGYK